MAGETGRALADFPGLTRAEGWELALEAFAGIKHTADKPAGALELNGWLELLWEDAPHLVVAGVNDGLVPDAVVGDAFLPESLRVRLGLKTNAMRFARDAYLLAALAAMRARSGRLDVLLGKVSAAGDPLRPSRLLLRCAEAELPRRIGFLFRNVETAQASLPWTRAWLLRPRVVPPPATLRVTALRDYLACPFRFYLKHLLRMEAVDLAKAELDARDFGTLLHEALQVMGEDETLRDCADEAVLRDALLAVFERSVRVRYGQELTLPLVVQFESARQRLRAAAAVQAREAAAGWRTERVEWSFALPLGGLTVRGKIDRLDRHADGRVRVLDYKTSDTPVTPAAAHLGPSGADDSAEAWARVVVNGKERNGKTCNCRFTAGPSRRSSGRRCCAGISTCPRPPAKRRWSCGTTSPRTCRRRRSRARSAWRPPWRPRNSGRRRNRARGRMRSGRGCCTTGRRRAWRRTGRREVRGENPRTCHDPRLGGLGQDLRAHEPLCPAAGRRRRARADRGADVHAQGGGGIF